jgi:hypothetical protein
MKEIHIAEHISSTFFDSKVVLLDQKRNTYYALNESAAEFWKILTQTGLLDAAVNELSKLYDIPQNEIERDINNLVQSLIQNGILEENYPHTAAS